MSDMLSTEQRNILIMLAQRTGSNDEYKWYVFERVGNRRLLERRCLICKQIVLPSEGYTGWHTINRHGFQHLKDTNLLPFT